MPKSNRLAAGETKLCTSKTKNWIPAFAGMTSKRKAKEKTPDQTHPPTQPSP
jgi:hypothetical protein